MAFISLKLSAALVIFVMAFSAGLLPWTFTRMDKKFFALGDAFADGIFLSIALFHMLPQAAIRFNHMPMEYPLAYLLCLLTFVVLVLLERGLDISLHTSHGHTHKLWAPRLLIAVLSIHSLLAGAALGVEYSKVGAAVIFIAIIAHKGAASFALGHYLQRFELPFAKHFKYITLFSLMTPLGIMAGTILTSEITMEWGRYLSPAFLALAAGTFLYIGSVHMFERPYFKSSVSYLSSFWSTLAGIGLMAIVAIWL